MTSVVRLTRIAMRGIIIESTKDSPFETIRLAIPGNVRIFAIISNVLSFLDREFKYTDPRFLRAVIGSCARISAGIYSDSDIPNLDRNQEGR